LENRETVFGGGEEDSSSGFAEVEALSVRGADPGATETDAVPRETSLTLSINGEELVTLLATPRNLQALVIGFLFAEGFIKDPQELIALDIAAGKAEVELEDVDMTLKLFRRRVFGSGCGGPAGFTSALDALAASGRDLPACLPWVDAQTLREAARFTFSRGSLYRLTRGTHAAALFGREAEMVAMAEDIGRHNAVDKVIGLALLEDRPLENLFMTVTGRISSEMVGKLAHTQIPLVLSKSAPTDLALDLAVKVSLSVVGRATAKGFTVYTCPEMVG